jgi:hypothetical protein
MATIGKKAHCLPASRTVTVRVRVQVRPAGAGRAVQFGSASIDQFPGIGDVGASEK